MSDVRSKIVKLLRLARDQEGTPEGDTAGRLAQELIDLHGVTIEDEDTNFDEPIVQYFITETQQRVWWKEMLLVTLCDIYGGEAVTLVHGSKFRLHVVTEDDVDELAEYFHHLCALVNDLTEMSAAEFMRATPFEREDAIASFCIGAIHRISQMLYEEDRTLETMPFMLRALNASSESFEEQEDYNTSLDRYGRNDQFSLRQREDKIEVIPNWSWFDCGYRAAFREIHNIHPPYVEDESAEEDEDLAL